MSSAVSSLINGLGHFKKDRVITALCFVPLVLGLALYSLLGKWAVSGAFPYLNEMMKSYIDSDSWGAFLSYILGGLLFILGAFIINWTFVLVVGILASPFNDIIAGRVHARVLGKGPLALGEEVSGLLSGIVGVLFNELKKVFFILILTIIAFFLGLIPLLAPVSLWITALLMSVSFLDYSWSRYDLSFRECVGDLNTRHFGHGATGLLFGVLMSIPVINLFALPYGVIVYADLFARSKKDNDLI